MSVHTRYTFPCSSGVQSFVVIIRMEQERFLVMGTAAPIKHSVPTH